MLAPGASVKKAAGALRQALQKDALRQQGYTWIDTEQYEHEVNLLQRFLVDTSVSGGGYIDFFPSCYICVYLCKFRVLGTSRGQQTECNIH